MPFKIVRNDITRVHADAIVNTANPKPVYGSGTDHAIYKAAGSDALLAERRKIGAIEPGDAAVTSAFALPAKYIIHTVGPVWADGRHGEYDTLASCYRRSLSLAESLCCTSIAFPLISSGTYGFPKEEALKIALREIRAFLDHSDMTVILVIFGRGTYRIASSLIDRVEAYIDENYEQKAMEAEYGSFHSRRRMERPEPMEASLMGDIRLGNAMAEERIPVPVKKKASTLEDAVNHLGESFQARLFRMIDEREMTDAEVYKRANVDRKLFSKIRCHEDYIPKKKTIIALAIGMRLNLDDTQGLLASAGYLLTNSSRMDVIVQFCIENGIYDIYEVNALLFRFRQPILG